MSSSHSMRKKDDKSDEIKFEDNQMDFRDRAMLRYINKHYKK
jgi:hypothetical protein